MTREEAMSEAMAESLDRGDGGVIIACRGGPICPCILPTEAEMNACTLCERLILPPISNA